MQESQILELAVAIEEGLSEKLESWISWKIENCQNIELCCGKCDGGN